MDVSRDPSDAVLLAQTRADPECFAAFYRRHERLVLAYLLRRCGDPEWRPVFVRRYRVFQELPATPENLAKLNMAAHPGARVLAPSKRP